MRPNELSGFESTQGRNLTAAAALFAAHMPEACFLAGDRDAEIDVDTIFAKPFERVLRELRHHEPGGLEPEQPPCQLDCISAPGYRVLEVESGVVLCTESGEWVGGYLSCDLAIAREHQGLGLGAELVLWRYLLKGDLPTWHLDIPAYSPAGEAAHRSAWRIIVQHPARFAAMVDQHARWLSALETELQFDHEVEEPGGPR